MILKRLFQAYLVLGYPINLLSKPERSKPVIILQALLKLPAQIKHFSYSFLGKDSKSPWSEEEKIVVRFGIVKMFYAPLMISFFMGNFSSIREMLNPESILSLFTDFRYSYNKILTLMFAIDTLVFAFGYVFEAGFLKNKIKTVEPTIIGWVVALATYPPFNSTTNKLFGWYSSEYFFFPDPVVDYPLKVMVVLGIGLYLWATLSLGTKASNLTNRGIVKTGAYKYIRHPAYAGKLFSWWLMMLPNLSIVAIISISCWTMIYYLRAITEEKHLITDPDYKEYVKETPYRFIPGIV